MALLHLPLKFLSALKSQVVWFMATAFNKHIYFTFRGLRQWHAKGQHLKKNKTFFYIECVNGIRLIIPKLALIARCVDLITCLLFWLCCFGTWGTANMSTRLSSKATGLYLHVAADSNFSTPKTVCIYNMLPLNDFVIRKCTRRSSN